MPNLTILIIRHAEKPDEAWPGPGLTPDGSEDDKSLVIRGWQRAGAWSALFGAEFGGSDYPRPDKIYAANPDATSGRTSHRPFETITPLAAKRDLTPVVDFAVGDEAGLVDDLKKQTGVVLVCWEHKAIASPDVQSPILKLLAGDQDIPGLPKKWHGERFDVVLRFDRSAPSAPWTFRQLFPCLLSGDSDTKMS
jgi:hypothetical protein